MKKALFLLILFFPSAFFVNVVDAGDQVMGVPGNTLNPRYGYQGTYNAHPSLIGNYGTRSPSGPSSAGKNRGDNIRQKSFPQDQETREFQVTQREECQQFLNETENLRKEFILKRSAYFAERENPHANAVDVSNQRNDIASLFKDIESRNTQKCRWIH
jgi:hypothetical protein